jgi:hypothetical protein
VSHALIVRNGPTKCWAAAQRSGLVSQHELTH